MNKQTKKNAKWLFLLLVLPLAGCICPGRLDDLKDCGGGSIGAGIGLSADVKAGDLTHLSLGLASRTWRVGHESRDFSGQWEESEIACPLIILGDMVVHGIPTMSYYRKVSDGEASDPRYEETIGLWIPFLMRYITSDPPKQSAFHTATEVEVGATLGVVGVRVDLNPLEFFDFLLRYIGLDIAGDDVMEPKPEENST